MAAPAKKAAKKAAPAKPANPFAARMADVRANGSGASTGTPAKKTAAAKGTMPPAFAKFAKKTAAKKAAPRKSGAY